MDVRSHSNVCVLHELDDKGVIRYMSMMQVL